MSQKNFMSYGDAETVFTEYANAIKSLDPEGGNLDTRLTAVENAVPSGASASNKLVAQNATARLLDATYQGVGMNQRVVKLTLPASVCGKFHVICETGGQTSLRDFIIQTTTRTPFVNVYNLGSRMDYIVKKANGNEIYINVPTSDGSVLIYQEDANADGYGDLYTVTLTTTTVTDEAFINANTVTPVNIHPTSSVTSGSTAPVTSGGVADALHIGETFAFNATPIETSFNNASSGTIFSGGTSSGAESGWYGFKNTSYGTSSVMIFNSKYIAHGWINNSTGKLTGYRIISEADL